MGLTFSPDPPHLLAGAGTATVQAARPREYANTQNGGWSPTAPAAATAATAGMPGKYTSPANPIPPADLAAANAASVAAIPLTAWTTGQYMVLGDGSEMHWTGTAPWVAGRA